MKGSCEKGCFTAAKYILANTFSYANINMKKQFCKLTFSYVYTYQSQYLSACSTGPVSLGEHSHPPVL